MMIASDRQIKLSTMTGKLTGFKAINTNTVTNEFCQKMNKTDSICGMVDIVARLYHETIEEDGKKVTKQFFQTKTDSSSFAKDNINGKSKYSFTELPQTKKETK